MSNRPERGRRPPADARGGEAPGGAAGEHSAWPGLATATSRAARTSGGPTGSSAPVLQVADVDRHPSAGRSTTPAPRARRGSVRRTRRSQPSSRRQLGAAVASAAGASSDSRRANGRFAGRRDRPTARRRRPPPRRGAARVGATAIEQRPVLLEDPPLHLLQLRRRIDAQSLDQRGPRAPEGAQRLALTAAAVQGEHVHRPQVLPERVLDRQRVQLGDHLAVAPGAHVGVDARLDRRQPQLVQSGDLAVERTVRLDVGVRMAAPQQQRVAQPRRHLVRIVDADRRRGRRPRTRPRRSSSRSAAAGSRRPGAPPRHRACGASFDT